MTDLLTVDDLSVRYPVPDGWVHALRGVSLSVAAGEILGIVGESGCGKSTLAYSMLGDIGRHGDARGQLRFQGLDVLSMSERALRAVRGRRIAMVPQHPGESLNPGRTIGDQLSELLSVHGGLRGAPARQRIVEVLSRVHLPDPENLLRRWPHELSGGQQQRVAIAMALVAGPELLVLDEPTTGLDVTVEAAVLELLREIRSDFGVGMVFISHNLNVVARLCDRVAVMYAGKIIELGDARRVFDNPHHPYTRALIDCIPQAGKAPSRLVPIPGSVPNALVEIDGCSFAARCALATADCLHTQPQLSPVARGHEAACIHARSLRAADPVDASPAPVSSQAGEKEVLAVRDLTVRYRVRTLEGSASLTAVADASFSVPSGTITAVVGESGSGKTSLASAVAGLRKFDAGAVLLDGRKVPKTLAKRAAWTRQFLQMVFQDHASTLNPELRAGRSVRRAVKLLSEKGSGSGDKTMALFHEVGLDPGMASRRPSELSGGQRQRIAIARAFAGDPKLVICDEITSALDVSVQAQVLMFLQKLQQTNATSLLFITHDLGVVRQVAQHVIVMYRSNICEIGPVEAVFAGPSHPYTRNLLRASAGLRPDIDDTAQTASAGTKDIGCPFTQRCLRRPGPVCKESVPPWRDLGGGHRIRCHLTADELGEPGGNDFPDRSVEATAIGR